MEISVSHCFLSVHDHELALGFYRDVLGLKVRNDVEFEGMRWVTLSPPAQPDLEIVLEPPGADPGISAADRSTLQQLLAKGLLSRLVLTTDDCDKTFAHIAASGTAEVVQEPSDQAYGVRDCAFRDPSGNMLRFTQARQ